MNTQEIKQLVLDGYKQFQAGDIQGMLSRYLDDAEWIGPESDYVPYAGSYHGKQGIAEFFRLLDKTVQGTSMQVKQVVAEGDTVVVTGDSSWIARSTGVSFSNPFVHIFKIEGDKVRSFRGYWDTSPAEHALHPAGATQSTAKPLHH